MTMATAIPKRALIRLVLVGLCGALASGASPADGALQTLLVGSDHDGLNWLAQRHDAGELNLLVRDDLSHVTGSAASADWRLDLAPGGRAGEWSLSGAQQGFVPKFWMVSFGNMVAVYDYSGVDPWNDAFDLDSVSRSMRRRAVRMQLPIFAATVESSNPGSGTGTPNFFADASQVTVFGSIMVPEPSTVTVWALLGLVSVFATCKIKPGFLTA